MKQKYKSLAVTFVTVLVVIALITSVPLSYVGIDNPHMAEQQYVGEAEAVAPVVVGGAAVAGLAGGSIAGYKVNDYFSSDVDSAEFDDAIDAGEDVQNETLRDAVHADSLISEGSSEDFLTNYDNDEAFIESNIEQVINREFVDMIIQAEEQRDEPVFLDDLVDESEAQNIGEEQTSTYLEESLFNIIETHNFQSYGVHRYNERLNAAGYGDDIGAIKKDSVDDCTSLESALNNSAVIFVEDDINCDDDITADISHQSRDLLYIDLQGNTINTNINLQDTGLTNVIFRNGELSDVSYTSSMTNAGDDIGHTYLINITAGTFSSESDNNTFYREDSDDVDDITGFGFTNEVVINDTIPFDNITFDPDIVANNSDDFDDADNVTKHTYDIEGENVTLTAEDITLDDSYTDKESAKVVVPYNLDKDAFVDLDSESIVMETSTSGISDYSEPHKFNDFYDLINDRNERSSDAFEMSINYVDSFYNENINEELDELAQELGALSADIDYADMSQREAYANNYVSTLDGTVSPQSDGMVIENLDTGEELEGALFVNDVEALTNQTDDDSKFSVGDTFTVDDDVSGFMVSERGNEQELANGDYEVVTMEGSYESLDVRNHDYESTNLTDIVQRQQAQEDVLSDTMDEGLGGVDFDVDDTPIVPIILIVLLLLLVIARNNNNSNNNGTNNYGGGNNK